jgi:hypothetical protein
LTIGRISVFVKKLHRTTKSDIKKTNPVKKKLVKTTATKVQKENIMRNSYSQQSSRWMQIKPRF